MRIGLDFDGVLADCGALKSVHAKKMYGLDIPPERFHRELIVKELAGEEEGHLTQKEYVQLQETVYGDPEIAMTAEPVEGMLEYLPRLLEEGYYVHVITSRSGKMLELAAEWAKQRGIDVGFTGVGHSKSKAPALKGFDMYIDDDLDKLEPLVDLVPHRCLFDWGYNAHVDEADIAERIESWEEFYKKVQTVQVPEADLTF